MRHVDLVRTEIILERRKRGLLATRSNRCTAEARGLVRKHIELHVSGERHAARVHNKDGSACSEIRRGNLNEFVKASRAQQRGVQAVGSVGGANYDHTGSCLRKEETQKKLRGEMLACFTSRDAAPSHHNIPHISKQPQGLTCRPSISCSSWLSMRSPTPTPASPLLSRMLTSPSISSKKMTQGLEVRAL